MKQLIQDIKKKKELKDLSTDFITEHIKKYLQQNPKAQEFLWNEHSTRSTKYKQIIKDIRSVLRRSYGLFRKDDGELEKLVSLLKSKRDKNEILTQILQIHSSTKERLPHYNSLYKKIFKLTGTPKTILDLGCGLNPFSLKFMKLSNLTYYAYDLSEKEVEMINKFFRITKQKGRAYVKDIRKVKLPKADVTFLFKMTDVIDKKGHKNTEELLKSIPSTFVVISFPTVTMSNKKMNFPQRKWVELLCERLKYDVKFRELPNEIFYVIKK
jgi:16S rRNA (guanine(1405)-N(7))-methyltransferase